MSVASTIFGKIVLDACTVPGHIAHGYIGYMLKFTQQKRICGEKHFSFSCRCSGIGRKVLPLALFSALFLSPSYLLINCQKKDSQESKDSHVKSQNRCYSPKFTIEHVFGLPETGDGIGPTLPDAVGESAAGSTLLNIRETIEKKAELGEIEVNTGNMKFALLDEAAGLFEIDADDNLTIKEQNSFLSAMQEGRTEFLLTLDGLVGQSCFSLSINYLPIANKFFVAESQSFALPYGITIDEEHGEYEEEISFGGELPPNHIGSVIAVRDRAEALLHFEIRDASPDGWEGLFEIDPETGMLSVTNDPARVYSHFEIPEGKQSAQHLLSELAVFYEKESLSLPADGKFVLTIEVSQKTSEGEDIENKEVKVELNMPAFGPEDCSFLELEEGQDGITAEQAESIKRLYCPHLGYEIRPRGIEFVTTQADLDALPDGLSQAKQNYQIIFRDEFSKERGPEVIDSRLWHVLMKRNKSAGCNRFESRDGLLYLKLSKDCSRRVALHSALEYKYGYMEAAFRLLPNGRSMGLGNFLFNSYARKFPLDGNTRRNVWCGGTNIARKRARWLSTYGVEKQYLELNEKYSFSKAWWVFHLDDHKRAEKCDSDRYMQSGVYWDLFYFYPTNFSGDDVFIMGVEWTPSGYRGFFNGEVYSGHSSYYGEAEYKEYGYTVNNAYGFISQPIPSSNLIGRTVSHAYQNIRIFMSRVSSADELPNDWEISAEVDYIRVYQPKDKYAGQTRVYD